MLSLGKWVVDVVTQGGPDTVMTLDALVKNRSRVTLGTCGIDVSVTFTEQPPMRFFPLQSPRQGQRRRVENDNTLRDHL